MRLAWEGAQKHRICWGWWYTGWEGSDALGWTCGTDSWCANAWAAAIPWARAWQGKAWLPKGEFQGFSEVVLGINEFISLVLGGFGEKLQWGAQTELVLVLLRNKNRRDKHVCNMEGALRLCGRWCFCAGSSWVRWSQWAQVKVP